MYKGIFWYNPIEGELIVKKVACDCSGEALEAVEYSSKSGADFNHKAEWAKLSRNITNGQPYNYYPRGRVEIKKNKATVYLSPILMDYNPFATDPCCPLRLIEKEFGIGSETLRTHIVADNSEHYQYIIEYPTKACTQLGR